MSAPTVSVIVPVHDTVDVLEECLESVLGQTLGDIEVLCVDDGSTDGSLELLERYAASDPRLTVIRREASDRGPGRSRNIAIDRSKGTYLSFVDSDDRIRPTMLEKLVAAAERTGADVAMCMLRTFDGEGEHDTACSYAKVVPEELDGTGFDWESLGTDIFLLRFATCNKIYTRRFVQEHGIRYGEDRYYEDLMFTFRSLLEAGTLTFVREDLYLNRKERVDATTHVQGDRVMDAITALEELEGMIGATDAYEPLRNACPAFAFRKMLTYLPHNDEDHAPSFYQHLQKIASRPELDGSPHLSDDERAIRERILETDLHGFLIWYVWWLQNRKLRGVRRLARSQARRVAFRDQVRELREENRQLRKQLQRRSLPHRLRRWARARAAAVVRRVRRI